MMIGQGVGDTNTAQLSSDDLYLLNEGTHSQLYRKLGAHIVTEQRVAGVRCSVWAPNAERVSVIGDFNGWTAGATALESLGSSGVWSGFIPGLGHGALYKYAITTRAGATLVKADPYAFRAEEAPGTASIVWDLAYEWADSQWVASHARRNAHDAPISVYEVHLGSWMRTEDGDARSLTYRELATRLTDYVVGMGFTHVEFMPVMEHPFYGSWGYQVTGYFAATSRYGTPQDLMYLIDQLHQRGIGVILDWVPSHFPTDAYALANFDGTALYEHADPRRGHQPDWDSSIFNYGRHEVCCFLLSSAMFWLDLFHADGLRVDAVASMLYRDYSRKAGEWEPNEYGGRENLEAVQFLRQLNETVYAAHPDVQMIAEESTAWPQVSRPTYAGGLGFGMKWDMGWMHDTLAYVANEPVHRKYHHGEVTFRAIYAFTENFMLALSHDETVHGKGSMLNRMPGDLWQQFANLRLLFAYQYMLPGKKLLFMGDEFGQRAEWSHEGALQWELLEHAEHRGTQALLRDLNHFYRQYPALYASDFDPAGFTWVDANDSEHSTLSFLRGDPTRGSQLLVLCNFTPVPRHAFRVGVSEAGVWEEVLNTDAEIYGGSGQGNLGAARSTPVASHGRPHSLLLTLPPLAAIVLRSSAQPVRDSA